MCLQVELYLRYNDIYSDFKGWLCQHLTSRWELSCRYETSDTSLWWYRWTSRDVTLFPLTTASTATKINIHSCLDLSQKEFFETSVLSHIRHGPIFDKWIIYNVRLSLMYHERRAAVKCASWRVSKSCRDNFVDWLCMWRQNYVPFNYLSYFTDFLVTAISIWIVTDFNK